MDKTLKMYLLALFGVVAFILAINLFYKETDWSPTYSLDAKNPLDLYVFNREIRSIIPGHRLKRVSLTAYEYAEAECQKEKQKGNVSYLVIKQDMSGTSVSSLFEKVREGCNLYVFACEYSSELEDSLGLCHSYINTDVINSDTVGLSLSAFKGKGSRLDIRPLYKPLPFVESDLDSTTILGYMWDVDGQKRPNFFCRKYGKGMIYIHNQPEVFTNSALLADNSSANYVAHLLSYIPKDRPVVWFVKGQIHEAGMPENETSLSVLFRYSSLRMTWLIFVYGLILYLIFSARRRQRVVPVIKPPGNTTVEFVKTIANLYFQEGDVPTILDKQIVWFLSRIRQRYYLDTSVLNDSFVDKLQNKSGKDQELIGNIVSFIHLFEQNRLAKQADLVRFTRLTDAFWADEKSTV